MNVSRNPLILTPYMILRSLLISVVIAFAIPCTLAKEPSVKVISTRVVKFDAKQMTGEIFGQKAVFNNGYHLILRLRVNFPSTAVLRIAVNAKDQNNFTTEREVNLARGTVEEDAFVFLGFPKHKKIRGVILLHRSGAKSDDKPLFMSGFEIDIEKAEKNPKG